MLLFNNGLLEIFYLKKNLNKEKVMIIKLMIIVDVVICYDFVILDL